MKVSTALPQVNLNCHIIGTKTSNLRTDSTDKQRTDAIRLNLLLGVKIIGIINSDLLLGDPLNNAPVQHLWLQ